MPDRSDEFRKFAADCIAIAGIMNDPGKRIILLTMARRWSDLANWPAADLDAPLRMSNEGQMSDIKPAMQQQQQIQPKRSNSCCGAGAGEPAQGRSFCAAQGD